MRTHAGATKSSARLELTIAAILVLGFLAAFFVTPNAQAQTEPYTNETPRVLPTVIHREPTGEVDGTATLGNRNSTGLLPFTGAELSLYFLTGLAAVGTGSLLVKRSRGA